MKTLTVVAILLFSFAAQANQAKIEVCINMLGIAVHVQHTMQQTDGLSVVEILDEIEKTDQSEEDKIVMRKMVSWGVVYSANSRSYLSTRFMQSCLAAAQGPFNMKGPNE